MYNFISRLILKLGNQRKKPTNERRGDENHDRRARMRHLFRSPMSLQGGFSLVSLVISITFMEIGIRVSGSRRIKKIERHSRYYLETRFSRGASTMGAGSISGAMTAFSRQKLQIETGDCRSIIGIGDRRSPCQEFLGRGISSRSKDKRTRRAIRFV